MAVTVHELGLKTSSATKLKAGEFSYTAQPAVAMGRQWHRAKRVEDPHEWLILDGASPPNPIGILRKPDYLEQPWELATLGRGTHKAHTGPLSGQTKSDHDPRRLIAVESARITWGPQRAAEVRASWEDTHAVPSLFALTAEPEAELEPTRVAKPRKYAISASEARQYTTDELERIELETRELDDLVSASSNLFVRNELDARGTPRDWEAPPEQEPPKPKPRAKAQRSPAPGEIVWSKGPAEGQHTGESSLGTYVVERTKLKPFKFKLRHKANSGKPADREWHTLGWSQGFKRLRDAKNRAQEDHDHKVKPKSVTAPPIDPAELAELEAKINEIEGLPRMELDGLGRAWDMGGSRKREIIHRRAKPLLNAGLVEKLGPASRAGRSLYGIVSRPVFKAWRSVMDKERKANRAAMLKARRAQADPSEHGRRELEDIEAREARAQARAQAHEARSRVELTPDRSLATFHPSSMDQRTELLRELVELPGQTKVYRLNGNVTVELATEDLPRVEAHPALQKIAVGKTWTARQGHDTAANLLDDVAGDKDTGPFPYPHEREEWGKRSTAEFLESVPTRADLPADAFKNYDRARRSTRAKASELVLISCGKDKAEGRHRALELYTGQGFKEQLRWFDVRKQIAPELELGILSAVHGLVSPDAELDAYNKKLSELDKDSRQRWEQTVAATLLGWTAPGSRIVVLAPAPYRQGWPAILEANGRTVLAPLDGLDQLQRRSALSKAAKGKLTADELEALAQELKAARKAKRGDVENPAGTIELLDPFGNPKGTAPATLEGVAKLLTANGIKSTPSKARGVLKRMKAAAGKTGEAMVRHPKAGNWFMRESATTEAAPELEAAPPKKFNPLANLKPGDFVRLKGPAHEKLGTDPLVVGIIGEPYDGIGGDHQRIATGSGKKVADKGGHISFHTADDYDEFTYQATRNSYPQTVRTLEVVDGPAKPKPKKKAKPKPKPKKKAPPKAPPRARGRARERFVDPITGEDVPASSAGAVPTGDYVARARARKGAPLRTVLIEPDELGVASYRIDLTEAELKKRAQAKGKQIKESRKIEAELGELKGKQALPGIAGTFRTAGQAARDFLATNEFYYAPFVEGIADAHDAIREWGDTQEVWIPKKGRSKTKALREQGEYRRLAKTAKGAKILGLDSEGKAVLSGQGSSTRGLLESVLTWVFSQTRSKRYADVEWHRIEALNDQLDQSFEHLDASDKAAVANFRGAQAEPIYPASSGRYEGAELLQHPEVAAKPRARASAGAKINLEALNEATENLTEAYERGRRCLAPAVRRTVLRRLRYLRELMAHPTRIATANVCAHARESMSGELLQAVLEAGGDIEEYDPACSFPLLIEDTQRLARVCDDGYNADWADESASAWEDDPEKYSAELEATPPAVLRRVATQRSMFDATPPSSAPPAPSPSFAQVERELDDREAEIFGYDEAEVEIPF